MNKFELKKKLFNTKNEIKKSMDVIDSERFTLEKRLQEMDKLTHLMLKESDLTLQIIQQYGVETLF